MDSIHNGSINKTNFETYEDKFNFQIPQHIEGVPDEILNPRGCWPDQANPKPTLNPKVKGKP